MAMRAQLVRRMSGAEAAKQALNARFCGRCGRENGLLWSPSDRVATTYFSQQNQQLTAVCGRRGRYFSILRKEICSLGGWGRETGDHSDHIPRKTALTRSICYIKYVVAGYAVRDHKPTSATTTALVTRLARALTDAFIVGTLLVELAALAAAIAGGPLP